MFRFVCIRGGIAAGLIAILSGCCSVKQYSPAEPPFEGVEAIYFSSIFSDQREGSTVDIKQHLDKIKQEYEVTAETDRLGGVLECKYHHKGGGASDGGEVTYMPIGKWNGQYIALITENTGGTGHFSGIFFYSTEDGKLTIHRKGPEGDRGWDGILGYPVYDGAGKIYFYSHIADETILNAAGISPQIAGADCFTPATGNGIIGKCVYDIGTAGVKVLTLTVFSSKDLNSKNIRSLLLPKMSKGICILDECETKKFFADLRELYVSPPDVARK
jgi:hypothetical protein